MGCSDCPLNMKTRVCVSRVTVGDLDSPSAYRLHLSAALGGGSRPYHALASRVEGTPSLVRLALSALLGLWEPREAHQGDTEDESGL